MSLLTALSALFGCSKKPDTAQQLSQLHSLSISCCHMVYTYGYSFSIAQDDGVWKLDAQCCDRSDGQEISVSGVPVSEEDVAQLIDILVRNDTIAFLDSYRPPVSLFQALDETTYHCTATFSDGTTSSAEAIGSACGELEELFYRLAEACAPPADSTDGADESQSPA